VLRAPALVVNGIGYGAVYACSICSGISPHPFRIFYAQPQSDSGFFHAVHYSLIRELPAMPEPTPLK
jgi:hypothetical protein